MRWDDLFADLEAQAAEVERRELADEVGDRTRREQGRAVLAERLRAGVGLPVQARCRGVGAVAGVLGDVGPDWLLLREPSGGELVCALGAVLAVRGLPSGARGAGAVAARYDLRAVLRAVARDRDEVVLHLDDGSPLTGTIDRAGADHLDLAEHAAGELRRRSAVRSVVTVPYAAVAVVRRG